MKKLVFASRSKGKLAELRALVADLDLEVISVGDIPGIADVVEDAETFQGNAIKKAREVSAATGLPALADDSGLEVDALGGRPGVYSARFAGVHGDDAANNAKLLAEMVEVMDELRTARFRCALAFADVKGKLKDKVVSVDGVCEGRVLHEAVGTGGFGYDPLFFCDDLGKTFAEAGIGPKGGVSHRARAMAALKPELAAYFGLAERNAKG